MNILANDGISSSGKTLLESKGFSVNIVNVAQEQLINFINDKNIEVLLVRSATKVRKELIDKCKNLKLIGRGGVGMDNIDVDYAKQKGLKVINTPAASSNSVAEIVFAHLFGSVRFLYDSNRNMPLDGDVNFKKLKKNYASGSELSGKTLGIIGFGRIGQATARIALGVGMKILVHDPNLNSTNLTLEILNKNLDFSIKIDSFEDVLKNSDFITLHTPSQNKPIIGKKEIEMMKKGAGIINASRGGVVDEDAIIENLDKNHLSFAAFDTFINEPNPSIRLLMHPKISLTPHIGAATNEAQDRIGIELAEQIIELLNN
ncbi:MAG: D-2-hydroxyacid dehydrogenase [Bacteroidota bacterium]|nr:D-2-hydroxyacid dehydrogenase [Bacteroidota bacterium]